MARRPTPQSTDEPPKAADLGNLRLIWKAALAYPGRLAGDALGRRLHCLPLIVLILAVAPALRY